MVWLAPLQGTPSAKYSNSYIVIFKEDLSTQDGKWQCRKELFNIVEVLIVHGTIKLHSSAINLKPCDWSENHGLMAVIRVITLHYCSNICSRSSNMDGYLIRTTIATLLMYQLYTIIIIVWSDCDHENFNLYSFKSFWRSSWNSISRWIRNKAWV